MIQDNLFPIIGAAIGLIIIIFIIRLIKKFSNEVNIFIRDTMKEKQADGTWKWSRTSIVLISAWGLVVYSYLFDLIKNGFNFEAFLVMCGIALGAPVTSAYSKKLNPLIQPPKDEQQSNVNN